MQAATPKCGEGDLNRPIPVMEGVGDHNPPLGEDHNFPLPGKGDARAGRFRPKVVMAAAFKLRGGGVPLPPPAVLDGTSKVEVGDHKCPHPNQAERRGATCGSPPLTGASFGAPLNLARGGRPPRRRLHRRASSEVT